MGTCKDDNTCDQPATKGEIETLQSIVVIAASMLVTLGFLNNGRIQKVQKHIENRSEYGTIGASNRGAIRDQHAIRELLDESPKTRKGLIRYEKAHQWDKYMENPEEKEWLEQQEWYDGSNPYRD